MHKVKVWTKDGLVVAAVWDPSETDGVSEDWLARLREMRSPDPWRLGFAVMHPESGVVIGTGAFKGPADANGVVEIAYGIAPEHQSRIFDRFERAVSGRHYGGLGLGLWIVRQILDALGGSIRVRSAAGEGSSFAVELPRVQPQAQ